MTQAQPLPICGVILAGGEGRRMGGQDKGWVDYQGQPLIQHVIQRLKPQIPDLLINANRNLDRYQTLDYPVVSDIEQGFHGPLMGILTGLKASSQEWILFAPCDGPFLPEDLAERLYQAAQESKQPIAVASDGERLQPVVVLIKRDCLAQLEKAMQEGERKPDRWYANVGMTAVPFAAASLRNFNRPEEVI